MGFFAHATTCKVLIFEAAILLKELVCVPTGGYTVYT